jgi:dTDP-4-dehydrorhamnose 3,5-epimerase
MQVIPTSIPEVILFEPKIFKDHRGYFYESYNSESLAQIGINSTFVQDNQSKSTKGVLRGLHFQTGIAAQAKRGLAVDILIRDDLRQHIHAVQHQITRNEGVVAGNVILLGGRLILHGARLEIELGNRDV